MIAVALVHQGLDASLELELGRPDEPEHGVRHRGGDRLLVTARADRAALEWAVALADRVVALTLGAPACGEVLAWALGRGATDAVQVRDAALDDLDLAATARVVTAAVRRIAPDVVVAGERGSAGATGALPALVAAHLGWASVDGGIRLSCEDAELIVERRLTGGRREELAVRCPAVVTVAADSVEPRYVSVAARRRAAARGHQVWALADLGLTADDARAAVRLRVDRLDWPRPRPRRTATPAPARSAAERLRQLTAGGPGRASAPEAATRVVEGDPRAVADRILTFLEQNGFA